MIKAFHDWKLETTDIRKAVKYLNQVIDVVIEQSKPFKQEVEFVKAFSSVAIVNVDGAEMWIRQEFCYFAISHPKSGEKVFIDNRHLFTP
jgi:hypothetical protein